MLIRVQKLLSDRKYCSRRNAEKLISEKRVFVNNECVKLGDKFEEDVVIYVDDKKIEPIKNSTDNEETETNNFNSERKYVYLALNKPMGVICTASDDRNRRTVVSLIDKKYGRVYPVGRLDINSKGLIFLTDDGEFTNLITHPSSNIGKEYFVKCKGVLTNNIVKILQEGVMIEDYFTSHSEIREVKTNGSISSCYITIHEGKNRQIRKMFDKFNLQVVELKRVRIGFYTLNEELKSGEYEELPLEVVDKLKEVCRNNKLNNSYIKK